MMEETLKILLVDSDAAARLAVRRSFTHSNLPIDITEVETCAAAIALLQEQPFDAVLLDYHLPDLNGLQLVIQARQLGLTVPLIVLTGQGDDQIAVELLKAGAADYLSKSKLVPEALVRSLFNAVRLHRAELQAAEAMHQLRASEERYRLVLEGSHDGIWDWDICHNEIFCNDRLLEIVGITREAMSTADKAFYRLIHPDDQARVFKAIMAHLKQDTPFDVEFRLQHASGTYRYCASRGKAQRDGQKMLSRMSGIVSDITTRKQAAIDHAQLYNATQQAEQNLREALIILGEHQQQLRTLQRLTDLLNQRLTNLPELLQVMVNAICDAIPNTAFGLIVLQNPYTGLLELTAATGTDSGDRLQLEEPFAPGEGLLGEIFLTGGSRLMQAQNQARDDSVTAEDDERIVIVAPAFSPTSPSLSPLISSSHPLPIPPSLCVVAIESPRAGRLGVLAIGNWTHSAAFNMDNLQLLVAFGEQAALALTNAQLINALEEREERLEVQNRILGEQNHELEEQRQQIQSQNVRLQETARLKSQFVATMSHELRTPMNAVIGFSQLLLRQRLTMPQRDMIDRILSNGRNLLALINDILDLSKIEAGRLELAQEVVNLQQLVNVTVEELRSLTSQKQLTLDVRTDLQNPLITTDSTRLRQVLVNLLSNAIKFTETGSICVSAMEISTDAIVLTVQDTGVGIPQEHLGNIFEAFHQIDQSLAKKFPGTGLGLAISALIVRKMNGRITVESELGVGSTFHVHLPRCVNGAQSEVSLT